MRNNSRKMIVADCWKYVSLLLQVQKGKECHSEAIRPRQSLIADSEWQLLRVILSPNFHTKQKWQLIRLSTFKVFQSASSRSNPCGYIWKHYYKWSPASKFSFPWYLILQKKSPLPTALRYVKILQYWIEHYHNFL